MIDCLAALGGFWKNGDLGNSLKEFAHRFTVLNMHRCAVNAGELVFAEAAQLVLDEAATAEEVREDEGEDRVAVIVQAVDLLPALSEVLFQLPEAGRLLNLRGFAFGF